MVFQGPAQVLVTRHIVVAIMLSLQSLLLEIAKLDQLLTKTSLNIFSGFIGDLSKIQMKEDMSNYVSVYFCLQ